MRLDDTEVFTGLLTHREKQVAEAVGRGLTYEAIRAELGMGSAHTVRAHVRSVAAKLPKLYGIPAQTRVEMWALSSDGRVNLADVRAKDAAAHQVTTQAA